MTFEFRPFYRWYHVHGVCLFFPATGMAAINRLSRLGLIPSARQCRFPWVITLKSIWTTASGLPISNPFYKKHGNWTGSQPLDYEGPWRAFAGDFGCPRGAAFQFTLPSGPQEES
ncbi:MAG: hypothetical protein ACLPJJ_08470 [Acidocella sp.]|uniref:hypothetical protein n=1 Tax=Acidocella sp. TaxID=50710 RepID=UPI003FD6CC1A